MGGNVSVWQLYKLYETQWERGFSGYRCRYDYGPVQAHLIHHRTSQIEFDDLIERLKIIEVTTIECDAERAKFDEDERKREATRKAL